MLYLRGFITGFLLAATVGIIDLTPEMPCTCGLCRRLRERITLNAVVYLGSILGVCFLVAVILWICLRTGIV